MMSALKQDQRDIGLSGAKSFGYLSLRHHPLQTPDFGHFFRGQEFFEASDETDVDGVLFVLPVIRPFEIRGAAIRLNAVNVINKRKIGWVWDEGNRDEPMDVECFSSSISPQADLRVSEPINAWSENLSIVSLRSIQTNPHSIETSHSSKSADFVHPFKFSNAAPFFFDHESSLRSMLAKANYVPVTSLAQ